LLTRPRTHDIVNSAFGGESQASPEKGIRRKSGTAPQR
jgi:hypothetical protein